KTRSFLTTLCIIIGIVMVTLMNAISNGLDTKFEESMAMLGQNVVYVNKYPWGGGADYKWWEYRNRPDMKLSYIDQISRSSRWASYVSATASRGTTIRHGDKSTDDVSLAGVTGQYFRTAGLNIEKGRAFTSEEIRRGVNVAVTGATIANKLCENRSSRGEDVRIGGQRFRVIGILERQGKFLGLSDMERRIITPSTAYGQIFSLRRGIQIAIKFPNAHARDMGKYEIEGITRRIRQLDATEDNNFAINEPEAFKAQLESFKSS